MIWLWQFSFVTNFAWLMSALDWWNFVDHADLENEMFPAINMPRHHCHARPGQSYTKHNLSVWGPFIGTDWVLVVSQRQMRRSAAKDRTPGHRCWTATLVFLFQSVDGTVWQFKVQAYFFLSSSTFPLTLWDDLHLVVPKPLPHLTDAKTAYL